MDHEKRVLSLCSHSVRYILPLVLLLIQDGRTLALKEGIPVWRIEFQSSAEQSYVNQLLVRSISLGTMWVCLNY